MAGALARADDRLMFDRDTQTRSIVREPWTGRSLQPIQRPYSQGWFSVQDDTSFWHKKGWDRATDDPVRFNSFDVKMSDTIQNLSHFRTAAFLHGQTGADHTGVSQAPQLLARHKPPASPLCEGGG